MAADTRHFKRAFRRLSEAAKDAVAGVVFDIVEARAHASGRRPKYVQVGAHDGQLDDPIYPHVARGTWDAVLLEPGERAYAALCELHAERPWVTCLRVGASSSVGDMSLFTLNPEARSRYPKWASGGASLDRDSLFALMALRRPDARQDDILEERIALRPLDDILVETGAMDADGLIIDVEGHEASVFEGTRFGEFSPDFILFESMHLTPPDLASIRAQLATAGYRGFGLGKDTLCLSENLCTPGLTTMLAAVGAEPWAAE